MYGIISVLPSPYCQQVEALWQELTVHHGLPDLRAISLPHFSWNIARSYEYPRLVERLQGAVSSQRSFTILTTGLGLFPGAQPVIYIPLVKTPVVINLHARLWQAAQPASTNLSPYYAPDRWQPHITLAVGDIDPPSLAAAVQRLAGRSFTWEMHIDSLAVFSQAEEGALNLHIQLPLED